MARPKRYTKAIQIPLGPEYHAMLTELAAERQKPLTWVARKLLCDAILRRGEMLPMSDLEILQRMEPYIP